MKKIFLLTINIILIMTQTLTAQEKETSVKISTQHGDIVIKLYNNTPLHRDNFIKLVQDGFYENLLFHRVINNFMIQGGDPESRNASPEQMLGGNGPGYTIPAEFKSENFHKKGAVAGARLPDNMNPKKESSGSQFYIVQGRTFSDAELNQMERNAGITYTEEQRKIYKTLGGTPHLDNNYTVFGEVVKGLDVLDKIASVITARGDRPVEDIKMNMTIIQ
jgi:cyclophilin family peptidyl-prolyl cis-trans isomerase